MNIGINMKNIGCDNNIKGYNIIEINSNEKNKYSIGSDISDVASECIKKNIDLYIDNSFINCMSAVNEGITTIRFGNKDDKCDMKEWEVFKEHIKEFNDWNDINNYINNNKLIKFMEFSENYSESINKFLISNNVISKNIDFVNKYIKTGGGFWFVIDLKTKDIVATVGLRKSEDNGIVENLYIDNEYINLNIKSTLRDIVSNFVKYNEGINDVRYN